MAADFIKIARDQSAATESGELLQWIRDLRSVYSRGVGIRAKMGRNFNSGDAATINWAQLETLWGIPVNSGNGQTPSVGPDANGKTIYTFIDGAIGGMEGVFQTDAAKIITERVG
jgi:hypothetical protein